MLGCRLRHARALETPDQGRGFGLCFAQQGALFVRGRFRGRYPGVGQMGHQRQVKVEGVAGRRFEQGQDESSISRIDEIIGVFDPGGNAGKIDEGADVIVA